MLTKWQIRERGSLGRFQELLDTQHLMYTYGEHSVAWSGVLQIRIGWLLAFVQAGEV